MPSKKGSAVYDTDDICEMFGVDKSRIPGHIKSGLIPPPIQGVGKVGQRKWSKAVIDKHLGIDQAPTFDLSMIERMIDQKLKQVMA